MPREIKYLERWIAVWEKRYDRLGKKYQKEGLLNCYSMPKKMYDAMMIRAHFRCLRYESYRKRCGYV